tara:strand:+ start:23 stop:862 length:840 start_codon:yes stop_codon:yes gene_type:complete
MATPSFIQKITDDGTLDWLYSVYPKAIVDDIVGTRSDTALATWIATAIDIHGEPEKEWTDREYWILNNTDFVGDTELRDSGAPDRTLSDLYDVRKMLMQYDPETYRELNEALFANGWYGVGATAESLDNRGASERAFHNAVDELVGQSNSSPIRWGDSEHNVDLNAALMENKSLSGLVDFSNLGNTPFTDTTADGEMRLTKDQINSMADNAAQTVFGRAPSDQEKTMVLNLVRGLEASGVHRPGASDARAELRRGAPVEARTQDMSGVLRNFMSIVAGR